MKHLITGGSGFLGSAIANSLLKSDEEVLSLDIWEAEDKPEALKFTLGSILDRDLVRSMMDGVDVVHHTAALVPLTKAGKMFHEVNTVGTRIVAEEAARAGVKYFVHTSSSTVFGKPPCPVSTASELKPIDPYGVSKLEAEQEVQKVSEASGMPLIVVRPRTMIATGRLGIFQILFEWIKEGRNIYVIGDGKNKIQFLHADDLISCYMFLCEKEKPGYYNVGSDRYDDLETTLMNLVNHAGTRTKVKHLPKELTVNSLQLLDVLNLSPLAPWHYLTYGEDFYFDLSPLTELGWKPKYSNDEMFYEAYDYFVEHFDEFSKANEGSAHRKKVKQKVLWLLKQFS